ncbi:MAG: hypothetical protein LBQ73_09090 [Tannerellaceae bacterium]|jgi:hypothetical protein|nr:hypothetical protein [Tannerellaceae bacterium]
MKKLLPALLAVVCLLSCEGPIGPMGPPGESGVQTQWKSVYYTVKEQDWMLVGGQNNPNSYYLYEFDEPALTDFIYEEGVVIGYVVANPGTPDEVLRPLPDTWPLADDRGDTWMESVTFDYMPGSVAFYVGYSDFATAVRPPVMTFKLMMIW